MDLLQLSAGCEAADGCRGAVSFLYPHSTLQDVVFQGANKYARTNRNWRWHKKLQIWLTKDDMMVPTPLSPNHERGYYVIWDTTNWRKERVWIS